jgi:hypothetical protein
MSNAMLASVEKSRITKATTPNPTLSLSSIRSQNLYRVVEKKMPETRSVQVNHCFRLPAEFLRDETYALASVPLKGIKGGAIHQILSSFKTVTTQTTNRYKL